VLGFRDKLKIDPPPGDGGAEQEERSAAKIDEICVQTEGQYDSM
jgi:hypothetical protein